MILIQCYSQTLIHHHNIFKIQQIGRNLEKSHKRKKKDYEESCKTTNGEIRLNHHQFILCCTKHSLVFVEPIRYYTQYLK